MKSLIITSILYFSQTLYGQQLLDSSRCIIKLDKLTKREVYSFNDRIPKIEGGTQILMKEIMKLKISKFNAAIENDYSGKIIIGFIIEVDGTVTGKRVLKNIAGTDIAEQLLNLIDKVKWIPEKCKGKKVPSLQIYPMIFHAGTE